MSIACSTSAFKMDLAAALAEVRQLGFKFVDLIAIKSWGHVDLGRLAEEPDYGRQITELLRQNRLTPIGMNLALPAMYNREAAANAQRLKELTGACRFMKDNGIAVASFYPGYKQEQRPWDQLLADSVSSIREMLAVAAKEGTTVAIELHYDTPFQTIEQSMRLLEAVPELKVAFDPSHFTMQGIDLHKTEPFFDRTVHVHLRDAHLKQMQAPFRQGLVDFEWLIWALNQHKYNGHYTIEYLAGFPGVITDQITRLRDWITSRVGG